MRVALEAQFINFWRRFNGATARAAGVPGCGQRLLTTRIDGVELRLNHFPDKIVKSSCGLPAKFFANLIRATVQPCWFCRPIKRRIMLDVFLPWKINNSESRFDEFAHRM